MKEESRHEQINPWTSRQTPYPRQALNYKNHRKQKMKQQQGSYLKEIFHHKNYIDKNKNLSYAKQLNLQSFASNRVNVSNIEIDSKLNAEQSLSNKIISFQYRQMRVNKIKKEKRLPFNVKTLRQFTECLEVDRKKSTIDANQYRKAIKIKRYFTEQKDYQEESQKTKINAIHNNNTIELLSGIARTQQLKRPKQPNQSNIKIVKFNKNNQLREEVITKGKLFEQVAHIYNNKKAPSHLSLMKRNYNIKKLEKLLRNEDGQLPQN